VFAAAATNHEPKFPFSYRQEGNWSGGDRAGLHEKVLSESLRKKAGCCSVLRAYQMFLCGSMIRFRMRLNLFRKKPQPREKCSEVTPHV
jgi:hypothetical protein